MSLREWKVLAVVVLLAVAVPCGAKLYHAWWVGQARARIAAQLGVAPALLIYRGPPAWEPRWARSIGRETWDLASPRQPSEQVAFVFSHRGRLTAYGAQPDAEWADLPSFGLAVGPLTLSAAGEAARRVIAQLWSLRQPPRVTVNSVRRQESEFRRGQQLVKSVRLRVAATVVSAEDGATAEVEVSFRPDDGSCRGIAIMPAGVARSRPAS